MNLKSFLSFLLSKSKKGKQKTAFSKDEILLKAKSSCQKLFNNILSITILYMEQSDKIFKFYANRRHPSLIYETHLLAEQCRYIKPDGEHCSRTCVIGCPLCSQHLMIEKHLKIKKSTIPKSGLGLFAYNPAVGPNAIIFRGNDEAGELICMYDGEIINKAELKRRYKTFTAPYGVEISANRYEDAARIRGTGAFVQHSDDVNKINCRLGLRNHRIAIFATTNVKNNKELFADYSDEYNLYEATHFSTR